jgi:tricorn protease
MSLAASTPSPVAPENKDEKEVGAGDEPGASQPDKAAKGKPAKKPPVPNTAVDLSGLSPDAIARRISAIPLPPASYRSLAAGKSGALYFLKAGEGGAGGGGQGASLVRWTLEEKKPETLAENVADFELSADRQKLLVAYAPPPAAPPPPGAPGPKPTYVIAAADKPLKPGDAEGRLKFDALQVRIDPAAEWAQMYREVWRIQRSYFYDPQFHGYDTVAAERRLAPYVAALNSRTDLNYLFQEMLTGFSVGHLRGSGGAMPSARRGR